MSISSYTRKKFTGETIESNWISNNLPKQTQPKLPEPEQAENIPPVASVDGIRDHCLQIIKKSRNTSKATPKKENAPAKAKDREKEEILKENKRIKLENARILSEMSQYRVERLLDGVSTNQQANSKTLGFQNEIARLKEQLSIARVITTQSLKEHQYGQRVPGLTISQINSSLSEITMETVRKNEEMLGLQNLLREMSIQMEGVIAQNASLQVNLEKRKEELEKETSAKSILRRNLEKREKELKVRDEEIKVLKEKLLENKRNSEIDMEAFEKLKGKTKEKIEKLNKEVKRLGQFIQSQEEEKEQLLESQLKTSEEQREKDEMIMQLQKEIECLRETIEEKEEEISRLSDELGSTQDQLTTLQLSATAQSMQMNKLEEKLEESQVECVNLAEENKNLFLDLENARESLRRQETEFKEQMDDLLRSRQRQSHTVQLREEIESLQKEIYEMAQENEDLKKTLSKKMEKEGRFQRKSEESENEERVSRRSNKLDGGRRRMRGEGVEPNRMSFGAGRNPEDYFLHLKI